MAFGQPFFFFFFFFFLHQRLFLFDVRLLGKHSVEVDPEVSVAVRAFKDYFIEADCWYGQFFCLLDSLPIVSVSPF